MRRNDSKNAKSDCQSTEKTTFAAVSSEYIFEAQDVVKIYASHHALSQVNIQVKRGGIFGLLGPNGAGKTTLIRIINRITQPDSGQIVFNGRAQTEEDLQRIGYLPEERGLYKKMQVGEQAMYLARLKGMDKAEARKRLKFWFEKFEIQPWWNKKVEELSKGMAQKVQFIVTVLHEPELLILDEPFSGFDPINTNLIKEEILRLKQNGTSIIFSTHNMGSVEELCDHIALINNSKVILDGEVNDIRKQFRTHTYSLRFKGEMLDLGSSLGTYGEIIEKGMLGDLQEAKIRLTDNATTNQLLANVMRNVEVQGFEEIIPSMNDIFIQAVEEETKERVAS